MISSNLHRAITTWRIAYLARKPCVTFPEVPHNKAFVMKDLTKSPGGVHLMTRKLKAKEGTDDTYALHETMRELQKNGDIAGCLYVSCAQVRMQTLAWELSVERTSDLFLFSPGTWDKPMVLILDHIECLIGDPRGESAMVALAEMSSGWRGTVVLAISNDSDFVTWIKKAWNCGEKFFVM